MKDKRSLLHELQRGLDSGIVSHDEVRALLGDKPAVSPSQDEVDAIDLSALSDSQTAHPTTSDGSTSAKPAPSNRLSAVDVMFHIAGIIMFVSIMSLIAQTWESGSVFVHILLSAGVGSGLWAVAHYLGKRQAVSDVRRGLISAIILTGSLSVIAGGFIVTNELIGGFGEVNFVPAAVTFAILGAIHMAYSRLVKSHLMLMLGVLLSVATFPALMFGLLEGNDVPPDVWSVIVILSALLLAYASRLVVRAVGSFDTGVDDKGQSYDSLVIIVSLLTMFFSSFTEYGILWTILLLLSVFGLFYASIVTRQKHMLGKASFFLVVAVLTISFKYFSGAGITISLVVATLGLLGSAAIASGINKKYFKESNL